MSETPNVIQGTVIKKQIDLGSVINRTFSALFADGARILLLVFLVFVPQIALTGFFVISLDGAAEPGIFGSAAYMVGFLIGLLLGPFATAAAVYGVFQRLRGQSATFGECLRVGASKFFPVLGVSILVGLATGIGMLFCLIPGYIIMCMYFVAVPALVVEDCGVFESISRSYSLTEGSRWHLFGLVFLIAIVKGIIEFVSQMFFMMGFEGMLGFSLSTAFTTISGIFFAAISIVAACVSYHDLRILKEGLDTEQLASVFE